MTINPSLPLLFALPLLAAGCGGTDDTPSGDGVELGQEGIGLNEAPVITLYEPIAGTTYTWNEGVYVRALVSDDDSPYDQLVTIRSDIDGLLGSFDLTGLGELSVTLTGLSEGTHTLSVEVQDPAGERSEVFVTVSVRENRAPGPPVIAINPADPSSADDLRAVVTNPADDPDGDVVSYVWSWSVDGEDAGISGDTVPADQTAEQEIWSVTAYATDGELSSESVTATATIGREGPEVTVSISPTQPYVDDELRCVAHAGDPSADEVSVSAIWYVGASLIGDASEPLSEAFAKGDTVTCEVEASSENGTTVKSAAVSILNSPPYINRTDVSPNVAYTDSALSCVPDTTDADGDVLSFTYEWTVQPSGGTAAVVGTDATLDPSTFVKADQVRCKAQADDGEETSAWRESATLVILNSPPTAPEVELAAEVVAGESAVCALVTPSSDPDYDALHYEYRWAVDGAVQAETSNTFNSTAGLAGSILSCAARAQDSDDTFSSWSLESSAQIVD